MKKIEVMIRKFDYKHGNRQNPKPKLLHKQILKLHRNIKKNDNIITEYSIERDEDRSKYHTHLLIHYTDTENLYNQLSRFIGGNCWEIREEGLNIVNVCDGKYGCVHTGIIRDEWDYRHYIDEVVQTKTLK